MNIEDIDIFSYDKEVFTCTNTITDTETYYQVSWMARQK